MQMNTLQQSQCTGRSETGPGDALFGIMQLKIGGSLSHLPRVMPPQYARTSCDGLMWIICDAPSFASGSILPQVSRAPRTPKLPWKAACQGCKQGPRRPKPGPSTSTQPRSKVPKCNQTALRIAHGKSLKKKQNVSHPVFQPERSLATKAPISPGDRAQSTCAFHLFRQEATGSIATGHASAQRPP